jgi:ESCRT-II complex subunit VPS25
VAATREKQLKLWKELILQYCISNNIHGLVPASFPYFKNSQLGRELNQEGITAVIAYIIKAGAFYASTYHAYTMCNSYWI